MSLMGIPVAVRSTSSGGGGEATPPTTTVKFCNEEEAVVVAILNLIQCYLLYHDPKTVLIKTNFFAIS